MNQTRRRGLIFTGMAIVLALITALLFFRYLNSLEREIGEKVEVVVAAQDIPARTLITEDMVKLDKIPQRYVRDSYLQRVEQVVGLVPLINLNKDDVLQANALGKGMVLEPERRAMAIAVDQVTGVGGILAPGDRVDILASYTGADGNNRTTLLLDDIEILAAGGYPSVTGEGLAPEESAQFQPSAAETTVILALGLEDAMKLAYMDNFGEEVRLILRRRDDRTSPSVSPVTLDDFK
jgi:pilus assembly protein CpaB